MRADRSRVEPLLRTARGQLDSTLKMIEDDRYCVDILTQLRAIEGLVRKAQNEVLRAHMAGCVEEAFTGGTALEREQKIEEIIRLLDRA